MGLIKCDGGVETVLFIGRSVDAGKRAWRLVCGERTLVVTPYSCEPPECPVCIPTAINSVLRCADSLFFHVGWVAGEGRLVPDFAVPKGRRRDYALYAIDQFIGYHTGVAPVILEGPAHGHRFTKRERDAVLDRVSVSSTLNRIYEFVRATGVQSEGAGEDRRYREVLGFISHELHSGGRLVESVFQHYDGCIGEHYDGFIEDTMSATGLGKEAARAHLTETVGFVAECLGSRRTHYLIEKYVYDEHTPEEAEEVRRREGTGEAEHLQAHYALASSVERAARVIQHACTRSRSPRGRAQQPVGNDSNEQTLRPTNTLPDGPMNRRQAAAFIQKSQATLTNLMKDGALPYHKRGNNVWFFAKEIVEALDKYRWPTRSAGQK